MLNRRKSRRKLCRINTVSVCVQDVERRICLSGHAIDVAEPAADSDLRTEKLFKLSDDDSSGSDSDTVSDRSHHSGSSRGNGSGSSGKEGIANDVESSDAAGEVSSGNSGTGLTDDDFDSHFETDSRSSHSGSGSLNSGSGSSNDDSDSHDDFDDSDFKSDSRSSNSGSGSLDSGSGSSNDDSDSHDDFDDSDFKSDSGSGSRDLASENSRSVGQNEAESSGDDSAETMSEHSGQSSTADSGPTAGLERAASQEPSEMEPSQPGVDDPAESSSLEEGSNDDESRTADAPATIPVPHGDGVLSVKAAVSDDHQVAPEANNSSLLMGVATVESLETGGALSLEQQLRILYGDGSVSSPVWSTVLLSDGSDSLSSGFAALAARYREISLTAVAMLFGYFFLGSEERKQSILRAVQKPQNKNGRRSSFV